MLVFAACVVGTGARAQTALPTLRVAFDRSEAAVSHWELAFSADGKGHYTVQQKDGTESVQAFALSETSWKRMRSLLEASHEMQPCGTQLKQLASTGTKSVVYTDTAGKSESCAFDHSDNKELSEAASMWIGIASTLDTGRRLTWLHRYDRLGLDAVMRSYELQLQQGFAIAPYLIHDELRDLVQDELILERVRKKALRILNSDSETSNSMQ